MRRKNDILWKGVMEVIFDDLLRFIIPEVEKIVDMNHEFYFLDKELSEMYPEPDKASDTRKTNSMDIFEQVAEMRAEEREQETRENFAKKLLTDTEFSPEKIASLTDISLAQVEKIATSCYSWLLIVQTMV